MKAEKYMYMGDTGYTGMKCPMKGIAVHERGKWSAFMSRILVTIMSLSFVFASCPSHAAEYAGFAYVANFGNNTISMYGVDSKTGRLYYAGYVSGGIYTRTGSITVDPLGRFAYSVDTKADGATVDNISVFTVDPATGGLIKTGSVAADISISSLAVDSTGTFLYAPSAYSNNIRVYSISQTTGALFWQQTMGAGTTPNAFVLHPGGKFAYAANSYSNNISMYSVNQTDGTLSPIGAGTIGAGTFPDSIAIDPTGSFAYVSNVTTNINGQIGTVSAYSINQTTGALTFVNTYTAGYNARSVAVDSSGKFVYVANWSDNTVSAYSIQSGGALSSIGTIPNVGTKTFAVTAGPNGILYVMGYDGNLIYVYDVNQANGSLTFMGTATGLNTPAAMAFTTNAASSIYVPKFAYVGNRGNKKVSGYSIDPATGAWTALPGTVSVDSDLDFLKADPTGRFLYAVDSIGKVFMYTINKDTGALTLIGGGWVAAGAYPDHITFDPTGKYAYVVNSNDFNVYVYSIDQAAGLLTYLSSAGTGGQYPYGAAVDPTGRFAYAANANTNNISMYTINSGTGALTSQGTVGAGVSPVFIAMDPTGRFAYAANRTTGISMYTMNQTTGSLTSIGTAASGSVTYSIAIDPSGKFAYAANNGDGTVSMYTINQNTGALTGIGTVAAGGGTTPVAVDPTGNFVYAANGNDNSISRYAINQTTGALTLADMFGTGAGSSPQSITIVVGVKSVINGVCGFSDGETLSSAPSAGLCSEGTASVVSGSGPWTWTCFGAGAGGTDASCSAMPTAAGCPAITLSPTLLPNGMKGTSYSQTITVGGGAAPYIISSTGTLPPGFFTQVTQTSAQISGTWTTTGESFVTVSATDNNGCTVSHPYKIGIEDQFFYVGDGGAVSDGPSQPTTFTLTGKYLITSITTYHYNYTSHHPGGPTALTISLQDSQGHTLGTWPATGTPYGGGSPLNANWTITPDIVLGPGTYTIVDSDPASWSYDAGSGGRGFAWGNAILIPSVTLSVSPSGAGSGSITGNGLNCSWSGTTSSGMCSVSLSAETSVSLSAVAETGSTFNGWSVDTNPALCPGTGYCSFSITANSTVTAAFKTATRTDGLIAYYPFNGNVNDESGNGHDGTIHGAVLTADRFGDTNSAYSFDEVNTSYIQVPSSATLDPTAEATMEAWVYFKQLPSAAGHIMQIAAKAGVATDLDLQAETNNKFYFYVANSHSVVSNTLIQTGVWYHVAATYKANDRIEMYINGALENTTLIPGVTRGTNSNPFTIGWSAAWSGRYFNGYIDDVSLFDRVLSAPEVQQHYAGGNAAPAKGVISLPRTGQTSCYDGNGVVPCTGAGQDADFQAGVKWPSPRFDNTAYSGMAVMDNLTGLIWKQDSGTAKSWNDALLYCNGLTVAGRAGWRLPNIIELSSLLDNGDTNTQPYFWSSTTYVAGGMAWGVDFSYGSIYGVGKGDFHSVFCVHDGPGGLISLPKTGQTQCYGPVACSGSGQDGDLQTGVAWPTPRYAYNGDHTITDKLTGLIWADNAGMTYPKCGLTQFNGPTRTWQQALADIACLNSFDFNGHSDWRLPNITELRSLIDRSTVGPALSADSLFANVHLENYWSSTTDAGAPSSARALSFYSDGTDYSNSKTDFNLVWPVRGGVIENIPNAFAFTPQTGVAVNTPATSNTITVAGLVGPAVITITGGGYSIGCTGTFTSSPGTVINGDSVCVRLTSSGSYSTATNASLTIGGVSGTFSVTTISDITPPTVISVGPAMNADPVSTGTTITASFSKAMNAATILPSSLTLTWAGGSVMATTMSYYNAATNTAVFGLPPLTYGTTYTATITTAVQDLAGNPLAAPYTWSFTTAPFYNSNLIINGDAEAGPGTLSGSVAAISGWTVTGNAAVIQYGASGGFPAASDPGPATRGLNFFAGGPDNASSSISQVIDVSQVAGLIDQGSIAFNLSGYLGGWQSQNDNAVLTAYFKDGSGSVLGSAAIGPVTAADRGNMTGLLLRSTSGNVPAGTRQIMVQLQMTRTEGSYNDGYADDLSLVLSPSSLAINTYAVNFAAGPNGSVLGVASQTVNQGGSASSVTAVPAAGYGFVNWTGDNGFETTTVNPLTVGNVTKSMNIKANFAPNAYKLSVSKSGSGTVAGVTPGINCGNDCSAAYGPDASVTLEAKPDAGYIFSGWTGCDKASGNYCTITIKADRAIGATFEKITVGITPPPPGETLDFGTVRVGRLKNKTYKITNKGKGYLTVSARITGDNPAMFGVKPVGKKTIKPKGSYALTVMFKPKSAGAGNATLKITTTDPNTPVIEIALTGTGQ